MQTLSTFDQDLRSDCHAQIMSGLNQLLAMKLKWQIRKTMELDHEAESDVAYNYYLLTNVYGFRITFKQFITDIASIIHDQIKDEDIPGPRQEYIERILWDRFNHRILL